MSPCKVRQATAVELAEADKLPKPEKPIYITIGAQYSGGAIMDK